MVVFHTCLQKRVFESKPGGGKRERDRIDFAGTDFLGSGTDQARWLSNENRRTLDVRGVADR